MHIRSRTIAITIALLSGMTTISWANDDLPGQESVAGIPEIVVTARRRSENLEDVPIAVSAETAATLAATQITSAQDLAVIIPGLTMTVQGGASIPFIRGVGSGDGTPGQESAIAIYIDGVYQPYPYGNEFALNNIDRVEVLKGPQGTLFGRNATGGLINIITRTPSHDTAAEMSVSYGDYQTFGGKFYGTMGVTDTIAADFALNYSDQAQGYGRNIYTGTGINRAQELDTRSKWLITPNEATDVTLAFNYRNNLNSQSFAYQPVQGTVTLLGTTSTSNFYDINNNLDPYSRTDEWGISARVNERLRHFDLVSLTSYQNISTRIRFDNDATPVALVNVEGEKGVSDTFTQEFQVVSNGTSTLKWIFGAYFLNNKAGWGDPTGLILSGVAFGGGGEDLLNVVTTNSYALYAETAFDVLPQTQLTLGARFTRDDRGLSGHTVAFDSAGATVSTVPDPALSKVFQEPTWRAILDHHFTEDVMAYASYSRGFKSGDFSTVNPLNPPFDPETLNAYEIGMKNKLFSDRLVLNGAVFLYKYNNLQLVQQVGNTSITVNAANATIRGAELEAHAAATEHLNLDLGFTYIHSRYDNFPNAPCSLPNMAPDGMLTGGNTQFGCNASGKVGILTPTYSANVGFSYAVPVSIGKLGATVIDYYNGGFFWAPDNRSEQGPYQLVNATLAWTDRRDRTTIDVYGKNLLNKKYSVYTVNQAINDMYEAGPPLTFGIEFKYKLK